MSTAVGPQDYPDWIRAPQVALSPLVNVSGVDLSAGVQYAGLYTGDAAGLVVVSRLGDGSAALGSTYAYTDDAAGTIPTGNYTVVYDRDGTDFWVNDILPVLGNFLTVTFPAQHLANLALSLTPLCVSTPGVRALPNERLAYGTDGTLAAGATLTANSLFTCACMATVMGFVSGAPCYVFAEAEDAAGNWFMIASEDIPTGGSSASFDVPLPRAPVRVNVANTSGGTISANVALTAHMR